MEGNGYFMNLRNRKRYTPYEFDLKMSHNEERMNRLGKIIDQDIYYSLMTHKKTPIAPSSGPNYVVENNKEFIPLNPNFNPKNEIIKKENTIQITNNSFKIPRSPRYNNPNQIRQYKDQENEIFNNNREYDNNNQNERFMNFENNEQNNPYQRRNNNFNELKMDNQYPKMINNENNLRNKNNMRFRDYDNDMNSRNKRYNDFEEEQPRIFNNNNYRSQEISKRDYVPRSPMNYEENDGNNFNNRYKDSFRERINDIDLNDMKDYNEEKKLNNSNTINKRFENTIKTNRRGYYNSQLNFPPKEEEEY